MPSIRNGNVAALLVSLGEFGIILFTSTGGALDNRLIEANPAMTSEARQQVADHVIAEIAREAVTDGTKYSVVATAGFLGSVCSPPWG